MILPPESGNVAEVEVEEVAFLDQKGLVVVEVQKDEEPDPCDRIIVLLRHDINTT